MTMARARPKFAGTHLENAPAYLREIEELTMGGWSLTPLPKVWIEDGVVRHVEQKARSATPTSGPRVPWPARSIRIVEPRAAPAAHAHIRPHHFEIKSILASRLTAKGVATKRAGYIEAYGVADGLIDGTVRATAEASYIEGKQSAEAERVEYIIATNGDSYQERMAFWDKANTNATFVSTHMVTVMTTGVEHVWDEATRRGGMPDELRNAVSAAKASPDGCATLEVNDAGPVRRWIKKDTRSFPAALRDHVSLIAPHNGRVAYSLIGQFAHDMSAAGRKACLHELVDEFTRRGVPCQAVIHEPTAKNSIKNWHFHLIYYAGQAERLKDGRWSFERVEVKGKDRKTRLVPLKRLPKLKEMSEGDWIPRLKDRWRDIVNERAEAEGIDTRFTNETNKKRGLPAAPARVSPGLQNLRKKGLFTDTEVQQATTSWSVWRDARAAKIGAGVMVLADRVKDIQRAAADTGRPTYVHAHELAECRDQLVEAEELVALASQADMLSAAMTSGPRDVLAHYGTTKADLSGKNPTDKRKATIAVATDLCDLAETHLTAITPHLDRLKAISSAAMARLDLVCTSLAQHLDQLAQPKSERPSIAAGAFARSASDALTELSRTVAQRKPPAVAPPQVKPSQVQIEPSPASVESTRRTKVGVDTAQRSAPLSGAVAEPADRERAAHVREAERRFNILCERLRSDRLVPQPGDHGLSVGQDILATAGLGPQHIVSREAQALLTAIRTGHLEELGHICDHLINNPRHLVGKGKAAALSGKAPEHILTLTRLWTMKRLMGAGLADVIGAQRPDVRGVSGVATWQAARAMREQAMVGWDEVMRRDTRGPRRADKPDRLERETAQAAHPSVEARPARFVPPFGQDMGR